MKIEFFGHDLDLRPDRTAFLEGALLVADLHLGKDRAFRQGGVAVPAGGSEKTLQRLCSAVETAKSSHLFLLGDIFHHSRAADGETMEALQSCLDGLAVEVVLVAGNHDRRVGGIEMVRGAEWAGVRLLHHPSKEVAPAIAGHIHPMIRLKGPANERFRVACFWRQGNCLVLPAFGEFTGGWDVEPASGDEVWAVAGGRVARVA